MSSSSSNTDDTSVSTTSIIAAVICTILSVGFCIGCCVFIVCLIKRFKSQRSAAANGMILQPYPPPYPNYICNYPPSNSSGHLATTPPYSTDESEFAKIPNA
jgi:hypothetical protein